MNPIRRGHVEVRARIHPRRRSLRAEHLEPRWLLSSTPTAVAGGPYSIVEGQSLTLNASQSSSGGGGPLAYTWDINGDGVYGDAIGVSPTLDWPLLNRLGISDGTSITNVRVRVEDTTFDGTTVNTLASNFYQQNRIVLNGLGVIVGQGDQTIFTGYYGGYNANSVVPIASGSKLISAVTFMRLVDQGLMNLDVPISNYLPDLVWSPALKQTMTLRQMLSHTSGLTGKDVPAVENAASLQAGAPLIASSAVALQATPGTEFDYGSNSYRLAAAAAERVTGLNWSAIVQQQTAAPLGMTVTWGGGANPNPAGSGRVTAGSYSNLLKMLMNEGVYNNQQFLSSNLVEEITTIQNGTTNPHPGSFYQSTALGYGFGQWIQGLDPAGRATTLSHFGSIGFKGAWDRTRGTWYVVLVRDPNDLTDTGGFFSSLVNQVNLQIDPLDVDSPPTSLTVNNAAPTASGMTNSGPVNEASPVNVSLTSPTDVSSADVTAGLRYSFATSPGALAATYAAAGVTNSGSFSFNDNGTYTVYGRVIDKDGGFNDYSTSVTVNNAAPAAGVSGPASLGRGGAGNFTFTASDPSAVDQAAGFTFTIDWNGDGSDIQVVNGASGLVVAHAWATVGARTIKVTATDKDGGIGSQAMMNVSVSAVQVTGGDLIWTGTAGADQVQFEQLSPTTIRVTTTLDNGVATNFVETINGVTGIVNGKGLAGNDTLDASLLTTTSATLNGGTGNNTVYGGGANDILIGGASVGPQTNGPEGQQGNNVVVGGAGDDTIYGNAINGGEGKGGNNILLGGAGNDTLYGNWTNGGEGGGRNIIVGSADADTLYDYKTADGAEGGGSILVGDESSLGVTELGAILSEWTSTRPYSSRVENILGLGTGPRNNGTVFLLADDTVTADAATDALWGATGGTGFNWFWYVLAVEEINRAKAGETHSAI